VPEALGSGSPVWGAVRRRGAPRERAGGSMGDAQSVLQHGRTGTTVDRLDGARCRGADAELFFGPSEHESRVERIRRESAAKSMCRDCPAVLACRSHALEHGEVYGVWGGLGEQERRTQLARLGRTSAPA